MAATASAAAASLGAAAAQLGLLPDGGQELAELLSKLQVRAGSAGQACTLQLYSSREDGYKCRAAKCFE
jgi:hypothetical protein